MMCFSDGSQVDVGLYDEYSPSTSQCCSSKITQFPRLSSLFVVSSIVHAV
jgi:hypothetical protein